MEDEDPLPFVSDAKPLSFIRWFADLEKLLLHPYLNDEERLLWLWLATQGADDMSFCCSLSYAQISIAVNKTPRLIHGSLFRLLILGFLIADIPVFYGEPTPEMVQKIRTIKLKVPYKIPIVRKKEIDVVLRLQDCYEEINLNLVKDQEKDTQPEPLSLIQKIGRMIKKLSPFLNKEGYMMRTED